MKHPDYDKAFHKTPDYIRSAIELGFMKGKKRMRARRRLAGALTAAAVLVVLLGAGTCGVRRLAAPRPDRRVNGAPLSAGGQTFGALSPGKQGKSAPNPEPAPTDFPKAPAESPKSEAPATTSARIAEPTPAPAAFDSVGEESKDTAEGALSLAEEATVESTPVPESLDSVGEEGKNATEAALPLVEEVNPESTPTPEVPTPGIDPTPAPAAHASAGEEAVPLTPGVDPTPASELPLVRLSAYADMGANPCFHLENPCGGAELPQEMNLALALWQGLAPCPDCVDGKGYRPLVFRADGTGDVAIRYALWYTESGNYFHVDANCSGMAGAREHDIAEAFASGKRSCPVCMENWACAVALDAPGSEPALIHALGEAEAEYLSEGASIAVEPAPATEIYEAVEVAPAAEVALDAVYYAEEGSYFHGEMDCSVLRGEEGGDFSTEGSGANGIVVIGGSLMDALRAGKDVCPVCLAGWNFVVNAVPAGEDAVEYAGAEAVEEVERAGVEAAEAGLAAGEAPESAARPSQKIYGAEAEGEMDRAAGAEDIEYEGGSMFVADGAEAAEETANSLGDAGPSDGEDADAEDWTYRAVRAEFIEEEITFVFAADGGGKFFHWSDACDGEAMNRKLSVEQALTEGLAPCPDCLPEDACMLIAYYETDGSGVSTEGLWYTEGGKYYHSSMYCDGMWGAEIHPIADAFASGKAACPRCMEGWTFAVLRIESAAPESTPTPEETQIEMAKATPAPVEFTAEASGGGMIAVTAAEGTGANGETEAAIAVSISNAAPYDISHRFYYTPNGQYYHMASDCSGMTGAKRHSAAETAASGKRHCPVCIGDRIEFYWLPAPLEDGNYDLPKLYDAAEDAWMPVVWSDVGKVFVPLSADGACRTTITSTPSASA